MESLHFLNITFAELPSGESTNPGEFNFFYISPLKSLNLVLIPGAKLDGHRGTWTGCFSEKEHNVFNPFQLMFHSYNAMKHL